MPKVNKKSTPPPIKQAESPPTLVVQQLRDRLEHAHRHSRVYMTMRDPMGFLIRAPLSNVRITMNDPGQQDFVEILVGT